MIAASFHASARPAPFGLTVGPYEDRHDWNRYVQSSPHRTFYHRFEWLDVIPRAFGHQAWPLAATRGRRLTGVLPLILMSSRLFGRFLVSLPFVNYGGLLADDEESERALWAHATSLAQRLNARHLEARHLRPHEFIGVAKHHKVTMVLDLAPTVDAQWKAFDAKLRNQIRKAEASSLSVTIGGASEVPLFYRVFARNMRDLGTPVYAQTFFDEVLRAFPDTCRLLIVRRDGEAVAAGIVLVHGETAEVPWAASCRDALRWCPNHRLYWEAIQLALKAGCRRFDFGRSTPGSGPYHFKRQWGAVEVPLTWEYWTADGRVPELNPHNPRYALAVRLWKRLPLAIANRLGPPIVRNIP